MGPITKRKIAMKKKATNELYATGSSLEALKHLLVCEKAILPKAGKGGESTHITATTEKNHVPNKL